MPKFDKYDANSGASDTDTFLAKNGNETVTYTLADIIEAASTGDIKIVASTDPAIDAAVTTAIVDAYGGVVITLTAAGNAQTIGDPTAIATNKEFVVANNDTSTDPITVNSVVIEAGEAQKFFWDGTAWLTLESVSASQISFTPTGNVSATNVQTAIAEVDTEVDGKKELHGIEASGALTFDNSTHILTIASGANTYWFQGVEYTTAATITCDIDTYETLTANTLYYFYFEDATGTLICSDTIWDFTNSVLVATVFWNGSAGAIQQETHGNTRDLDWHEWAHDTIGTRYVSGSTLTYPDAANDDTLQIETGVYHDEDLTFVTGQETTMRGWYQVSSGVYTFVDYATPYLGTAGQPQWLDTDDYTLKNVGASDFVSYWIYAANDTTRSIYVIPTQAATAYNTIGLARADTVPEVLNLNINSEMKLIYKLIYKGDGEFQESIDYRGSSPLPGGGVATVYAGAVSYNPTGNVAATDVQTAITELDTEKLPIAGGTMTGDLLFTDNTLDIGASGATRPRTGYFGTSVVTPKIIGGTDASDDLTLQSSSNATKGKINLGLAGNSYYDETNDNLTVVDITSKGINWASRTSAADNDWYSVIYGNGIFVAVANTGTGNRVMTSPDGVNWVTRTSAADNNWRSVTYGNGLFVTVAYSGTGNRVMTSPDGVNWVTRTSAADNNWVSVTYGNGLFVAVANTGTGNRVMTSPDGITWTSRTSASDNDWYSVTYGNGIFVVVANTGTGNRVMTSPDGITWTSRTSATDNNWFSVAYGNGLFVAVASSGTGDRVMISPDGVNWVTRTSATDNNWAAVTYGNGIFVAVANAGTGDRVMTSGKTEVNEIPHDNHYNGGMTIFGNVGIAAKLDISYGGIGLLIGADSEASTITNVTAKDCRVGMPHYTNTEEPIHIIRGASSSTANDIYIGGGFSGFNAATSLNFYTAANNTTVTGTSRMTISTAGLVNVVGELTAGTKTFFIDHPLLPTEKTLTHAVFEGPEHGLIYRGISKLEKGKAIINIDDFFGMTAGTFEALAQDITVQSLQNQDGFDRLKPGNITGANFEIICENADSDDEISWMIIASRKDKLVKFSDQNDSEGRLILENDKIEPTEKELKDLDFEEVETEDESKIDTEEIVIVDSLTDKKGYYRNFEAFGQELPTKIKKFKLKAKSKEKESVKDIQI